MDAPRFVCGKCQGDHPNDECPLKLQEEVIEETVEETVEQSMESVEDLEKREKVEMIKIKEAEILESMQAVDSFFKAALGQDSVDVNYLATPLKRLEEEGLIDQRAVFMRDLPEVFEEINRVKFNLEEVGEEIKRLLLKIENNNEEDKMSEGDFLGIEDKLSSINRKVDELKNNTYQRMRRLSEIVLELDSQVSEEIDIKSRMFFAGCQKVEENILSLKDKLVQIKEDNKLLAAIKMQA